MFSCGSKTASIEKFVNTERKLRPLMVCHLLTAGEDSCPSSPRSVASWPRFFVAIVLVARVLCDKVALWQEYAVVMVLCGEDTLWQEYLCQEYSFSWALCDKGICGKTTLWQVYL